MNKILCKLLPIVILFFIAAILISCGNDNKISDTDMSGENSTNRSYNDTASVHGSNSRDIKNDELNKKENIGNSNVEKDIETVNIETTNNNTDNSSEEFYDPVRIYEQDVAKIDTELMVTALNATDTSITLQFNNFEGEEAIHGVIKFRDDISIERINDDGTFLGIPKLSTYKHGMYENNMYDLDKTSITEYYFNWESIYGKLEPGNYRIIVRVHFPSSELRSTHEYYKYAYFSVD